MLCKYACFTMTMIFNLDHDYSVKTRNIFYSRMVKQVISKNIKYYIALHKET